MRRCVSALSSRQVQNITYYGECSVCGVYKSKYGLRRYDFVTIRYRYAIIILLWLLAWATDRRQRVSHIYGHSSEHTGKWVRRTEKEIENGFIVFVYSLFFTCSVYCYSGFIVPQKSLQQLCTRDIGTGYVRHHKCIIRNIRTPREIHDLVIIITYVADHRITHNACLMFAVDFFR